MEFINKYYRKIKGRVDDALNDIDGIKNPLERGIHNDYHGTSIDEFKAKLGQGLFKPSQYLVEFNFPKFVEDRFSLKDLTDVGHLVETTDIPQKQLNFHVNRINGKEDKYPYKVEYTELTCTVIDKEDHMPYNVFTHWMDNIVNPITNSVKFFDDYAGEAKIKLLDINGFAVKKLVFKKMFPYSINPIALSYNDKNTYGKFTVSFVYKYYIDEEYEKLGVFKYVDKQLKYFEDELQEVDKIANKFIGGITGLTKSSNKAEDVKNKYLK